MNNLLESINWGTVGIVLAVTAVLAIVFAVLIVTVSKLCAVKEDEKAKAVSEKLAGANCGGCGFAGCADFAKALSEGKADISMCGPTPNENKAEICEILGLPFSAQEEAYAIVHCAGGNNAKDKYDYVGTEGCVAQANFMGGKKLCPHGCMGGGTCESLCPYNAIKVVDGVAYTNKALCEACGLCVKNCPKSLIKLIPPQNAICIEKGIAHVDTRKCIGCGLCAKNCPEGAITMVDNLPVIDYSKCSGCLTCVGKCPRKCIKEI